MRSNGNVGFHIFQSILLINVINSIQYTLRLLVLRYLQQKTKNNC